MTRLITTIMTAATALFITASCGNKTAGGTDNDMQNADTMSTEIYVDVVTLRDQTFHRQLICNGKLQAVAKCDLTFDNASNVGRVLVQNGARVARGQIIATTDATDARLDLEKAQKDLEKANVDLADRLIGLGYDGISPNVPDDVMHRAKVASGFFMAQYQLQAARNKLRKCSLAAPISGRIADLGNKRGQRVDKICTIIDDTQLDVEFCVLEAEIKNIHRGQRVIVSPFVDETAQYDGTVTNINPTVDDKGLIKVTARIANPSGKLMDGMNVKVVAENDVPHSLVVPKDAVVERDGYHVVFMYKDGEAVWTYVDIAYSNMSSFAITGCKRKETHISAGDRVITSGNLNLADGTKVKLKK